MIISTVVGLPTAVPVTAWRRERPLAAEPSLAVIACWLAVRARGAQASAPSAGPCFVNKEEEG